MSERYSDLKYKSVCIRYYTSLCNVIFWIDIYVIIFWDTTQMHAHVVCFFQNMCPKLLGDMLLVQLEVSSLRVRLCY